MLKWELKPLMSSSQKGFYRKGKSEWCHCVAGLFMKRGLFYPHGAVELLIFMIVEIKNVEMSGQDVVK